HARRRHDADEALRRAAGDRDRARGQEPAAPRSCDGLEAARADLTRRHGEARGWLPREAELRAVQARREHLRREADELRHGVAALEAETDRSRRQVAGAESEREPLLGVVATRDALVAEAARAAAGESAARETLLVREELRRVVAEQQALAATALRLRSAHLDARQARIEGAAAELATRLAVGCSCPVCGSTDHPAPARRAAGVGQDDEDAALEAFESAESARLAADEGVAGVRARLAAWEARSAGHDLAGWSEARERADAAVAGARRAAARLDALDATLDRLRPVLERAGDDLGRTRAALAEREVALEELRAQQDGLAAALSTLLSSQDEDDDAADDAADEAADDRSHDRPASVAALVADLAARCERLTHLIALERAVDTAAATARQAGETADAAATQAGFADVDAALAAVLDDDEASRARDQVATWDRDHADATRVLGDAEVVVAMAQDRPDVAATRAGLAAHVEAHEEAVGARRAAEHREHRVGVLRADLDTALEAWHPLRERHRSLAGLSSLVEGTSPDNRLRMRLTGYVLAERLHQVVAAANVRLTAMTDDRFALEHAEEKGAGEQRGGLSLRVRDDWSGTRRDPATLSGGESFVVSLALALGLADTVAQEAGGTTVETLFVDEGFGALDSDTLDAVMDVLDGLRDGGRVVGLVSHVAELRARVPAQLEVRKGRHGSTVAGAVHAG
ncbi:SbcC/MukB-like Walker B domain-containing protein, partial [Nocardioides marmoraquaticus]